MIYLKNINRTIRHTNLFDHSEMEFQINFIVTTQKSIKDMDDFCENFPKEGISALNQENSYLRHDHRACAEAATFLNELKSYEKRKNYPTIKKVIFNAPATIVYWSDGDKTVVKYQPIVETEIAPGVTALQIEEFDPEKGLAMAVAKKFLGKTKTHYDYYEEFKKWLGKLAKELKKKEKNQ